MPHECVCLGDSEGGWADTERAGVSVSEGYAKAISGLFNISERGLAHFHNHHLSFPDPPRATGPSRRNTSALVQRGTIIPVIGSDTPRVRGGGRRL